VSFLSGVYTKYNVAGYKYHGQATCIRLHVFYSRIQVDTTCIRATCIRCKRGVRRRLKLVDVVQGCLACGEDLGDLSADPGGVDGGSGKSRCCRTPHSCCCCSGRPGDRDLPASGHGDSPNKSNVKENFLGCGRAGGVSISDDSSQVRDRSVVRWRELIWSSLATDVADLCGRWTWGELTYRSSWAVTSRTSPDDVTDWLLSERDVTAFPVCVMTDGADDALCMLGIVIWCGSLLAEGRGGRGGGRGELGSFSSCSSSSMLRDFWNQRIQTRRLCWPAMGQFHVGHSVSASFIGYSQWRSNRVCNAHGYCTRVHAVGLKICQTLFFSSKVDCI